MGDGFMYYDSDVSYSEPNDDCKRKKRKLRYKVSHGKASPITYEDVSIRRTTGGGVTAVINAESPDKDYYGVCHFH